MDPKFAYTKYAGVAATTIWSCEWIAVAYVAVLRLGRYSDAAGYITVAVAGLMALLGILLTARGLRRMGPVEAGDSDEKPGFWGKVGSWLAGFVWIAVGIVWNLAMTGVLIRAAQAGQYAVLLVVVPFALIGLLLLLVVFVGLAVALDSLLGFPDPPTSFNDVSRESTLPKTLPPASVQSAAPNAAIKLPPLLGILLAVSMLNWFAFFGITMCVGGDALGTLPSRDGFIVKSHGRHKVVSESVWKFNLYYSGATLLLTPSIWIVCGAWQFGRRRHKSNRFTAFLVCGFVLVWAAGWYSSIGNSMLRSIKDWKAYKGRELQARPAPDSTHPNAPQPQNLTPTN